MSQKNYFIHESSVVDEPVKIGDGTKIWHFCHISTGATIGSNCSLGQNVYVSGKAKIGNNVKIQNNVSVYDGVTLENYVFCGPSMVFTNDINPRSEFSKDGKYQKTLVKEGTSIGANVTIISQITIGSYAFIGAGSVITKDVPDHALVFGNPAKIRGWISDHGTKLNFADTRTAECTVCEKKYTKINEMEIKQS